MDTHIELHFQVAAGMYTVQNIVQFRLQYILECYISITQSKTLPKEESGEFRSQVLPHIEGK